MRAEGDRGLLLAGTDNRWEARPALQGQRGERGDGWAGGGQIDGWVGDGEVHANDLGLWPEWTP